jgi:surface protein
MPGIHNGIGTTFRSTAFGGGGGANNDFVIEVDTTQAGSASDTIILPLQSLGTYSGTIDWGDSSSDDLTYANRQHTYAAGGTYTITISGTDLIGWGGAHTDRRKLIDISNWGFFTLSAYNAFQSHSNLDISATDAPNITATNLSNCFFSCPSLTTPDFSNWDVSGVTNMRQMFYGCQSFNGNIDNWDVSSVTTMSDGSNGMLANCYVFNRDISGWNVSSNTIFGGMFRNARAFNQNVGNWNVSGSNNFRDMFHGARAFDNGGSDDIDSWDVAGTTNFSDMFREALAFNRYIGSWDMSSATSLYQMFTLCTAFNKDISSWDVSNVSNMRDVFYGCTVFNQPIGSWNTSSVTNMRQMFFDADSFDQDISGWDINQVTDFNSFMQNAPGLSTANYDALLIAWDAQGAMSYSGTVNFGGSKYTAGGAAEAARTSLISKWGGITDGGAA